MNDPEREAKAKARDLIRKGHGGGDVRVGIIGVGNCARALIEGIHWYRAVDDQPEPEYPPGLMHPRIGPYLPHHVKPVAAWDVDADKVGQDLSVAIRAGQNLDVGIPGARALTPSGVTVHRAPTLDGVGRMYHERIREAADHPNLDGGEILEQIKDAGVDVLLNYLPVGSQAATEWWAHMALTAGCAFVNNIPVFIARKPIWRRMFREAGLPLIGDDIKSQLGATYLHRLLVRAFRDRGIRLDRTYQLNVGGNMDFYNMLERDRLASKRESKSSAVTDAYDLPLDPASVHIGPSDYVQWLGDRKKAFVRCEGTGFAGTKLEIEIQMTVPDSPNSAGVVIDAARLAKLALDRQDPSVDEWVSAWLFKAPPPPVSQVSDQVAMARLDEWIAAGC